VPIDLQATSPATLICAVLGGAQQILDEAAERLSGSFGPVRQRSAPYDFDYTDYYEREMGRGLIKQLLWLEQTVAPEQLASVKLQTMEIEGELADTTSEGTVSRRANIDPGLVTVHSLVLSSTKYSGHRICIGPGLFAEVTLLFQEGGCRPFDWTYPDYRSDAVQHFLLEIRQDLLAHR